MHINLPVVFVGNLPILAKMLAQVIDILYPRNTMLKVYIYT